MNLIIENVLLYGFIASSLCFFFFIRKQISEISASEYKELKDLVSKYPELITEEKITRVSRADFVIIKRRYKHHKDYVREKNREMKDNPELVNSRKEFLDSLNKDQT